MQQIKRDCKCHVVWRYIQAQLVLDSMLVTNLVLSCVVSVLCITSRLDTAGYTIDYTGSNNCCDLKTVNEYMILLNPAANAASYIFFCTCGYCTVCGDLR